MHKNYIYFSLFLWLGASACGSSPSSPARLAATLPARAALGVAAEADLPALSDDELRGAEASQAARRSLGWRIAAQVVEPVMTAAGPLPRFMTWYAGEDIQRMFASLYDDLGSAGRRARGDFSPAALAGVEAWNVRAVLEQSGWSEARLEEWIEQRRSDERRQGLSGLSRTLFSGAAARHLLAEYASTVAGLAEARDAPAAAPGKAPDNFSLLFRREMPATAVIVKAAWRRVGFGVRLPAYPTDAASLAARFAASDWGDGEGDHDPSPDQALTMASDSGARFRLVGLHVMTKQAREWVWVSLWWSPDATRDFGADRSGWLREAPWSHYKMCIVTGFEERGRIDGELAARHPDLAAALSVTASGGAPTWCSNPYIEEGRGNQRTNCVGCHQHGGSGLDPAGLADAPQPGARARENFPADYLWSATREPEALALGFQSLIRYYDVYDPLDGIRFGRKDEGPVH